METVFETGVDEMSWDDIVIKFKFIICVNFVIIIIILINRNIIAWVESLFGQQSQKQKSIV